MQPNPEAVPAQSPQLVLHEGGPETVGYITESMGSGLEEKRAPASAGHNFLAHAYRGLTERVVTTDGLACSPDGAHDMLPPATNAPAAGSMHVGTFSEQATLHDFPVENAFSPLAVVVNVVSRAKRPRAVTERPALHLQTMTSQQASECQPDLVSYGAIRDAQLRRKHVVILDATVFITGGRHRLMPQTEKVCNAGNGVEGDVTLTRKQNRYVTLERYISRPKRPALQERASRPRGRHDTEPPISRHDCADRGVSRTGVPDTRSVHVGFGCRNRNRTKPERHEGHTDSVPGHGPVRIRHVKHDRNVRTDMWRSEHVCVCYRS
ncbi:MAG: hypothetical protein COV99_08865 [Bacteroidetes bacterium CG12_big_fil_rev_8_21_14_0_65_60_17]|nr:MAG: hypothetical protein COV99_08865 [Bacteroidetes bacterium CG12_big_fil_rev_8_21_14_0_65_60_17]